MKKSKKNYPYIIEFNGIPGSGKTTIASELKTILEKENKSVCLYSDFYKINCHNRLKQLKDLLFYFFYFMDYFLLLMRITKKIKRDYKYILSSAINFCGKIDLYKNSKEDFIIVDQGIIQEIESIFFLNDCNTEFGEVFELINKYFDKLFIVNTFLKVEVACERINKRKNGSSRADGIKNYDKQRKMLEHEEKVFENIRKSNNIIPAIEIESNNNKESAKKIIEFLRKEKYYD